MQEQSNDANPDQNPDQTYHPRLLGAGRLISSQMYQSSSFVLQVPPWH